MFFQFGFKLKNSLDIPFLAYHTEELDCQVESSLKLKNIKKPKAKVIKEYKIRDGLSS